MPIITFDDIPDDPICKILCCLSARDVLNVALVSRRLRPLATTQLIWRALLRADFDLRLEARVGDGDLSWYDLYQSVASSAKGEALRFKGLSTDGGCDENRGEFWVDNMFTRTDDNSAYCSTAGENVHCMGVLLGDGKDDARAEAAHRDYLIRHCQGAATFVMPGAWGEFEGLLGMQVDGDGHVNAAQAAAAAGGGVAAAAAAAGAGAAAGVSAAAPVRGDAA